MLARIRSCLSGESASEAARLPPNQIRRIRTPRFVLERAGMWRTVEQSTGLERDGLLPLCGLSRRTRGDLVEKMDTLSRIDGC